MAIRSEATGSLSDPMTPRIFVVERFRRELHDTFTLELTPGPGMAPIVYRPGQFNMLYAMGVGEAPISISGDPAQTGQLIHTIRSVGAVTEALGRLRSGDALGLRGPYGRPWPVEAAAGNDVLIIAGGIGLAPLRPAIYCLLAERHRYGRVALLYGARSPREILYRRQLERWRARFDIEVEVTVDRAAPEWRGSVGVVTTLLPRVQFDPDHTTVMICGPEVMMRHVARDLIQRGVAEEQIHLSMERNMKCAIGFCGHCQYGPKFICRDGPVFDFHSIGGLFGVREI